MVATGRMEAFSDGVFAVAITLLVLDLTVPRVHHGGDLGHDLLRAEAWPHYVAYVVSFLTIGIIWINHDTTVRRLQAVDRTVLAVNLQLLMTVVALPFTTNLMATYLTAGYGHGLAAALYGGSFLVMSLCFAGLQVTTVHRRPHLLRDDVSTAHRRAILRRNLLGVGPYVVATAVAPLSAYATLAICGAVAVYYALPLEPDQAAGGGD